MKYKDEFQRIIEASENHTLSFFVGAGVSSLSGVPSWRKLIQAICEQIDYTIKEEYSSVENLRIPQIFYHSIDQDKDKYYKFMDEQLGRKKFSTNLVHRELLSFNQFLLLRLILMIFWKQQLFKIVKALLVWLVTMKFRI